jgi:hypothetical protein
LKVLKKALEGLLGQLDRMIDSVIILEKYRSQISFYHKVDLAVRKDGCDFLYQRRDQEQVSQTSVGPADQYLFDLDVFGIAFYFGIAAASDIFGEPFHKGPAPAVYFF